MKDSSTEEESGLNAVPSLISDSDDSCTESTCAVPELMEPPNTIVDFSQLWVDSFKHGSCRISGSNKSDPVDSNVFYRGVFDDNDRKNVSNID